MKKRDVLVSDDSVVDIENGMKFYDKQQDGLGQYFFDCIYSDLESLRFYAGIHSNVDFVLKLNNFQERACRPLFPADKLFP